MSMSKRHIFQVLGVALLLCFAIVRLGCAGGGDETAAPAPATTISIDDEGVASLAGESTTAAGSAAAGSATGDGPSSPDNLNKSVTIPGEIAFNPPAQMYVDAAEAIEVVIGEEITKDMRRELLRLPEVRDIRIAANGKEKMRVELKGSKSDFDIDYQGSGSLDKIIRKEEPAYWTWNVTPKRVGKNKELTLVASILLADSQGNFVPGSDGKPITDEKVFHRRINIDVDPSATTLPTATINPSPTHNISATESKNNNNPHEATFVERVLEEPLKAMLMILLPAIGTFIAFRINTKKPRRTNTKSKK